MGEPRITEDEVRRIAHLARLSLDDDEVPRLTADLAEILDYVERIAELELADEAPQRDPGSNSGDALRDDEPRAGLSREAVLDAAPRTESGHFLVPKVIDG